MCLTATRRQGFQWRFIRYDQLAPLVKWARHNAKGKPAVASAAVKLLVEKNVLRSQECAPS